MDWMHQHHEAVEEINAYYSFIFRGSDPQPVCS